MDLLDAREFSSFLTGYLAYYWAVIQSGEVDNKTSLVLGMAVQRYEETSTELKRIQEACSAMETARDEVSVSRMVSSAVSAGVIRALEQERDEAISSLNLQFKAILKRMQGEFRSSRER